jgi:hypothetical protein
MKEKPIPPNHEFIHHPVGKILGDHSQAEHNGASYKTKPQKRRTLLMKRLD